MSKAKNLGLNLGGKWKYDGVYGWWCDDGVRHVIRCSAGVDEWDNPARSSSILALWPGDSSTR